MVNDQRVCARLAQPHLGHALAATSGNALPLFTEGQVGRIAKGAMFGRPLCQLRDSRHTAIARRLNADVHTAKGIANYFGVGRAPLYEYLAEDIGACIARALAACVSVVTALSQLGRDSVVQPGTRRDSFAQVNVFLGLCRDAQERLYADLKSVKCRFESDRGHRKHGLPSRTMDLEDRQRGTAPRCTCGPRPIVLRDELARCNEDRAAGWRCSRSDAIRHRVRNPTREGQEGNNAKGIASDSSVTRRAATYLVPSA